MKYYTSIFFILLAFALVSCGSDDDICTSGEATPRMKIKFKDANNKIIRLDSLHVNVDYGDGKKSVYKVAKVDSVLIPLRVDESEFTNVYIKETYNGAESEIKLNYTTNSEYVSPACGIKKTYSNVSSSLETADPVTSIEQIQTQILNEDKTFLYLIF